MTFPFNTAAHLMPCLSLPVIVCIFKCIIQISFVLVYVSYLLFNVFCFPLLEYGIYKRREFYSIY